LFWIPSASHFFLLDKLSGVSRLLDKGPMYMEINLMLDNCTAFFSSLEYLVRRPLGAAALEASYVKGPEHVEEAGYVTSLE
jgi:hypothetical protein